MPSVLMYFLGLETAKRWPHVAVGSRLRKNANLPETRAMPLGYSWNNAADILSANVLKLNEFALPLEMKSRTGSMERRITTYEQAIEYLYSRINYERVQTGTYTTGDFKLERVRQLLARLGNPHESIPAVHIAGTKGKGTTAAMVAGILEAAGYRVGLFTSPHISRFEERIQVNGQMPSRADLVGLVRQAAEAVEPMDRQPGQMAVTFFELTMALGWLWFQAGSVDVAVLEVGLGGRLDATNICRPVACAITTISRDHTGLLGSTLPQIAEEKAGIIKPGIPVVTGVEEESAHRRIAEICRRQHAPLFSLGREIHFTTPALENAEPPKTVSVETPVRRHESLGVPLTGRHQHRNAAVAVGLMDVLVQQGWQISEDAIRQGLAATKWPLRIEVVQTAPFVVLDVAHNWASVQALLETLNQNFPAKRRILIFAASRDKDVAGMLRLLLPQFDSLIVTEFLANPRASGIEKLQRLVHSLSGRFAHAVGTPAQAWQLARRMAGPDDLICGGGSFFIAAELREVIVGEPTPQEGWLAEKQPLS